MDVQFAYIMTPFNNNKCISKYLKPIKINHPSLSWTNHQTWNSSWFPTLAAPVLLPYLYSLLNFTFSFMQITLFLCWYVLFASCTVLCLTLYHFSVHCWTLSIISYLHFRPIPLYYKHTTLPYQIQTISYWDNCIWCLTDMSLLSMLLQKLLKQTLARCYQNSETTKDIPKLVYLYHSLWSYHFICWSILPHCPLEVLPSPASHRAPCCKPLN